VAACVVVSEVVCAVAEAAVGMAAEEATGNRICGEGNSQARTPEWGQTG
jgi:hypothetical protein